jgi:prepilin-type processing-associated H-X9-DG protein
MEPVPLTMVVRMKINRAMLLASFTVVELLVVMAIIAILVSILVPSLQSAKQKAGRIKCTSNLRQIGLAVEYYKDDNEQFYPIREPNPYDFGNKSVYMNILGSNYMRANWGVFRCPLNKNLDAMDQRTNTLGGQMDYEMNSGVWSMRAMSFNAATGKTMYLPARCVILFDYPGPHAFGYGYSPNSAHPDGGMNAFFADGHVELVPLDQANKPVDGMTDFYEWGLKVL